MIASPICRRLLLQWVRRLDSRRLNGGQEQGEKYADDGNHHQHFGKRESATGLHGFGYGKWQLRSAPRVALTSLRRRAGSRCSTLRRSVGYTRAKHQGIPRFKNGGVRLVFQLLAIHIPEAVRQKPQCHAQKPSGTTFLTMGWVCMIAAKPILEIAPGGLLDLMLGGGAAYTLASVLIR